ncbi:MAG: SnoaL-like domain protein [Gemmataceae bacterium]|nr:SnoaL-like domain protein [Gemmataceae bacterium]
MRTCATSFLALAVLAAGSAVRPVSAEPPKGGNPEDEAALLKRAEAFVEAFHKGDAEAVAAFWTTDGDYTDVTGKRLAGRGAIQKSFGAFFAENKGAKLRIEIDSLRFITPEVAIEDGVTTVLAPESGPPSRAKYTIVHVKKDGQWHLGSVREAAYVPPSNYEHLRGLEGLIGSWADEAGGPETARVSFAWSETQNFITSTFATTHKNVTVGGGTQWIGWDPAAKTIRSWAFHANGGFGEATWTRDGKTWTIKTAAVLPDGKKATATDVITVIDADTISFQAKDRTRDGKAIPDVKEIRLKRVK